MVLDKLGHDSADAIAAGMYLSDVPYFRTLLDKQHTEAYNVYARIKYSHETGE